ncbi:MAG: FadR/GntR family transcriptional regulator [Firmicutes bacterium]|nr:FadR/GntR family transcriptional regulator [Bacillota bacterium]
MDKSTAHPRVLYQEVAAQIEQMIMRGKWVPGQKLPALAELAAHFEVSRAVVREACSVLVGAGLVELRHGDGTYVRSFSIEHFLRPMHAALLLGQADVRSLLEVGAWLEQGMVQTAASKRTDEQCAGLLDALFAMEVARGDVDAMLESERSFHFAIAIATDNEMGANLMRILYQPLSGVLRHMLLHTDCEEEWLAVHRALYDSILQMDGPAAVRQILVYRTSQMETIRKMREFPLMGKEDLA